MKRLKLDLSAAEFVETMDSRIKGDAVYGPVSQIHFMLLKERERWIKEQGYKPAKLILRMNRMSLELLYTFILSCSLEEARKVLSAELEYSKIMLYGIEVDLDETVGAPVIKARRAKLKR